MAKLSAVKQIREPRREYFETEEAYRYFLELVGAVKELQTSAQDQTALAETETYARETGGSAGGKSPATMRSILDVEGRDPEDATDSGTDTYDSETTTSKPGTGKTFLRDFQSANTTSSPTLDGTSLVDVAGNAWAGMIEARVHRLLDDGTNYVVLDPVGHVGGLVPIVKVEADDDAVVFLPFENGVYRELLVILDRIIPATGGGSNFLGARFRDGGSTHSGSDHRRVLNITDDGGLDSVEGATGSRWALNIAHSITSDADGYICGEVRVFDTGGLCRMQGHATWMETGLDNLRQGVSGGRTESTLSNLDGVAFECESGNITSGTFYLYGIRED